MFCPLKQNPLNQNHTISYVGFKSSIPFVLSWELYEELNGLLLTISSSFLNSLCVRHFKSEFFIKPKTNVPDDGGKYSALCAIMILEYWKLQLNLLPMLFWGVHSRLYQLTAEKNCPQFPSGSLPEFCMLWLPTMLPVEIVLIINSITVFFNILESALKSSCNFTFLESFWCISTSALTQSYFHIVTHKSLNLESSLQQFPFTFKHCVFHLFMRVICVLWEFSRVLQPGFHQCCNWAA